MDGKSNPWKNQKQSVKSKKKQKKARKDKMQSPFLDTRALTPPASGTIGIVSLPLLCCVFLFFCLVWHVFFLFVDFLLFFCLFFLDDMEIWGIFDIIGLYK